MTKNYSNDNKNNINKKMKNINVYKLFFLI